MGVPRCGGMQSQCFCHWTIWQVCLGYVQFHLQFVSSRFFSPFSSLGSWGLIVDWNADGGEERVTSSEVSIWGGGGGLS